MICTPGVEGEFRQINTTSESLRKLLTEGKIKRGEAESVHVKLYGEGERDAINLAMIDRKLID